jgi:ATP synthase protein I
MRVLCLGAGSRPSVSTIDFASVRRQALWVVVGQVAVAVCGALICYAVLDMEACVSALIGGGIGAAATLVQAVVGLRNSAGKEPRAIVSGFYRGSAMKLVVTVALFVVALRGRRLAAGPLFVTYVATFLVYWLALARSFRQPIQ